MSTDPNYSPATGPRTVSVHLPLAFVAFAIAIFLFTQIRSVAAQSKFLRWQMGQAEKQQTALVELEKQYKDAFTQREPAVKQSVEVQTKYQQLFSDLLELAKDDEDAKKVVEAWKIQKPNPPAAAPGATPAAPAATPAPAP